ncbi:hypothetical protein TUMEXPCC7403_08765 [Tumidithrix helvetica PCC 7403]|uniref:hypothetical protein n=1 Tax=Tumidithrix helvetica TaxID=3457545 RepID=UPI003CC2F2D1
MGRFLYVKSISYRGYLILPFVRNRIDGHVIYSYTLLSELGHKGNWHKAENPAGLYSDRLEQLLEIAKEHLDQHSDCMGVVDYFKRRYVYRENLVVIHQAAGKCFYDHYPPNSLINIAAPKIFRSEFDCINWVKHGLDRNRVNTN